MAQHEFASDVDVRWCPGCGDYAILSAVQKTLQTLGLQPHETVFVSGIGCSSRFPYYLSCYGFHTLHGRAPTVATGLKLIRPELSVWIVTGDGDGLSIGLGHLLHLIRRNLDVTVLLLNNQVYGLTKGQYSPTSPMEHPNKTAPSGVLDRPLDPLLMALAAGAGFVGRGLDTDSAGLQILLAAAARHTGTSFVEIYQNCPVFQDNAFGYWTDRQTRAERTVWLMPGQPAHFGARAIAYTAEAGFGITEPGAPDVYVHSGTDRAQALAWAAGPPSLPLPLGILYQVESPAYEALRAEQRARLTRPIGGLATLLRGSASWTVS